MLVTPWLPASETAVRQGFTADCVAVCTANNDAGYCTALCGCLFESLYGTDLFNARSVEAMTPDQRQRWDGSSGNAGVGRPCRRRRATLASRNRVGGVSVRRPHQCFRVAPKTAMA